VGRARELVAALEHKLSGSFARHAAPVRAYVEYLRVWAMLAYARGLAPGSERTRLLDEASASLKFYRSIGALSAIWSAPLEPAVEVLRGRKDAAVKLLSEVVADRGIAERLPVYAVYARRALGALTGGSAGDELVREADAFLREHGVVDPERFVASTAPGLESAAG